MNVSETPAKDLSPTIHEGITLLRNVWIQLFTDEVSCPRRTELLSIKQTRHVHFLLISLKYLQFLHLSFPVSVLIVSLLTFLSSCVSLIRILLLPSILSFLVFFFLPAFSAVLLLLYLLLYSFLSLISSIGRYVSICLLKA
jgi:hypothetical protein